MTRQTPIAPSLSRARRLKDAGLGAGIAAMALALLMAMSAPKVELWEEEYVTLPAETLRQAARASAGLIGKEGSISLQEAFVYNGSSLDPGLPELSDGQTQTSISKVALIGARDALRAQSEGYWWHRGEQEARSEQGLARLEAARRSIEALSAAAQGPVQTLDAPSAFWARLSLRPGFERAELMAPWASERAKADPEFRRRVQALSEAALADWTPKAALAAAVLAFAPLAGLSIVDRSRRRRQTREPKSQAEA